MRPEVLQFAGLMERKLREHDGDRGDSWRHLDQLHLLQRLKIEVQELDDSTERSFFWEAVDIANFAMFIVMCEASLPDWPEGLLDRLKGDET